MRRPSQLAGLNRGWVYGIKAFILLAACLLLITVNAKAQECKAPDLQSTINEKYKEIGLPYPEYFVNATVIAAPFYWEKVQWIGVYREGPVGGALLAYDCDGKLLSIQRTGGIKSVMFYNAPDKAGPAVAVEEIWTGTGFYQIKRCIYSIIDGKIRKIWEHVKFEGSYGTPGNSTVDSFDFINETPGEGKRIRVDGVRKLYPSYGKDSHFYVKKLKTESYCWDGESISYRRCK